jgi:hypothetical protein
MVDHCRVRVEAKVQRDDVASTERASRATLGSMKQWKTMTIGALLALAATACDNGGARSHSVPWGDDRTQVIDAEGNVTELEATAGDDCLDLENDVCIRPQEECDGRAADVVLDGRGELLEIICYPEEEILSVEEIEAQDGNVEQNQNDSVIVLDGIADGVDIAGDLSVDANNVVIYGDSAENSLIDGDVYVDGNNIIVRGVRIQGAVEIVANNAVFLHCVIEGDVSISGNNAVLSACDVLGNVQVTGQNAKLSGNRVTGELSDQGQNTICEENMAALDADEDGVLSESEIGAPISCRDAG